MAGSKSDYAEIQILKYILTTASLTRPTLSYVALGTGTTGDAFSEVADTSTNYDNYTRKQVNMDQSTSPYWGAVGGGSITTNTAENTGAITFNAGITGDTSLLKEFAICDSATTGGGNVWYRGDLTSNLQMGVGVVPEFASGAIDISEA